MKKARSPISELLEILHLLVSRLWKFGPKKNSTHYLNMRVYIYIYHYTHMLHTYLHNLYSIHLCSRSSVAPQLRESIPSQLALSGTIIHMAWSLNFWWSPNGVNFSPSEFLEKNVMEDWHISTFEMESKLLLVTNNDTTWDVLTV